MSDHSLMCNLMYGGSMCLWQANDDDYLASAWADPKQLQRSLRGTGSVRAPGV